MAPKNPEAVEVGVGVGGGDQTGDTCVTQESEGHGDSRPCLPRSLGLVSHNSVPYLHKKRKKEKRTPGRRMGGNTGRRDGRNEKLSLEPLTQR